MFLKIRDEVVSRYRIHFVIYFQVGRGEWDGVEFLVLLHLC